MTMDKCLEKIVEKPIFIAWLVVLLTSDENTTTSSTFAFIPRILDKIHDWKQLVGLIIIIPITQLFTFLNPQTAPYGLSIALALILLCFYIVRKNSKENTFAAYARGNLNGHETLLNELEKELQTSSNQKDADSIKKMSFKVKNRLETYRRIYKNIKKI
jgi:hypothetical protein